MPTVTTLVAQRPGEAAPRAHILFVDDEPHLLDGLRRMLRPMRDRWETSFVTSGAQALDLMDQAPVDAIVSDMRMPGMNGAQLLTEVQRRQPSTVRMILSGQADRASVLSATRCAQQFLAKPCDATTLSTVVNRALEIRSILADPALREAIGRIGTLPTLPSVYHELVRAMDTPDIDLASVARILASDVSTSAEMLKLMNSAFFGLPRGVSTVEEAVSLLGLDNIQALMLAGSVFQVDDAIGEVVDVSQLRQQALQRSALAHAITTHEGWPEEEISRAALACMLLEVGALALAQGMPDRAARLRTETTQQDPDGGDLMLRARLQSQIYGCTVPQASAYLLGLWGFAPSIVHTVASQPLTGDGLGVSGADLLVAFAQAQVLTPGAAADFPGRPLLDDDTVAAWTSTARTVLGR
jgi:HD-like signal output (HDOD) protein/ActR/RegA family two-component response regulator